MNVLPSAHEVVAAFTESFAAAPPHAICVLTPSFLMAMCEPLMVYELL